jgi:hypothetical protein
MMSKVLPRRTGLTVRGIVCHGEHQEKAPKQH